MGKTGSFSLGRETSLGEGKFECKPIVLRLNVDLVSHVVRGGEVGCIYIYIYIFDFPEKNVYFIVSERFWFDKSFKYFEFIELEDTTGSVARSTIANNLKGTSLKMHRLWKNFAAHLYGCTLSCICNCYAAILLLHFVLLLRKESLFSFKVPFKRASCSRVATICTVSNNFIIKNFIYFPSINILKSWLSRFHWSWDSESSLLYDHDFLSFALFYLFIFLNSHNKSNFHRHLAKKKHFLW